jgi:hypothetical protein
LAGNDTQAPQAAIINGLGYMTARVISEEDGTFATYDWELDTTVDRNMNLARCTYLWEGMNSWYATTLANSYVQTARFEGVGFAFFDLVNLSSFRLAAPGLDGSTETILAAAQLFRPHITSNAEWNALRNGVAPRTIVETHIFMTQRWEAGHPNVALDPADTGGNNRLLSALYHDVWPDNSGINSEDPNGYRATQPWECDFLDIIQTNYFTFLDDTDDSALGAEIELDNDVPVGNNIAAVFQEHMFLAGDPDNPHYLYWSKRFRPESWPLENFIEIGTAADPIRSIQPQTGVLGVFTSNT